MGAAERAEDVNGARIAARSAAHALDMAFNALLQVPPAPSLQPETFRAIAVAQSDLARVWMEISNADFWSTYAEPDQPEVEVWGQDDPAATAIIPTPVADIGWTYPGGT